MEYLGMISAKKSDIHYSLQNYIGKGEAKPDDDWIKVYAQRVEELEVLRWIQHVKVR